MSATPPATTCRCFVLLMAFDLTFFSIGFLARVYSLDSCILWYSSFGHFLECIRFQQVDDILRHTTTQELRASRAEKTLQGK